MTSIDSNTASEVMFRSPFGKRVGHAFSASVVCVLIAIIVAASVCGVFVFSSNGGPPPVPAVIVGIVVGLVAGSLVGIGYRRRLPTSLRLRSESLLVGGRWLGMAMLYEEVRLTRLEVPEHGSRRCRIIHLRGIRGPEYALWLSIADAEDCYAALRGFCDRAAVIGSDGEVETADGETLSAPVRDALAEEFRRRAIRSLASAVALVVIAVFFAWMLLGGNVSAYGRMKAIAAVILLPIGAIGLVFKFFVERRHAREMDS